LWVQAVQELGKMRSLAVLNVAGGNKVTAHGARRGLARERSSAALTGR
jgi:hypothetical protein